ncbi:MAG: formylglycine-generating enzyme family protein [Myxococcota bacterium]|nr:formylglycine-generating enzyme family protein [Myxococcota bacterium]
MIAAIAVALALGAARRDDTSSDRCGSGFAARGPRCAPVRAGVEHDCPQPLVATPHGCDAADVRVLVPAATLTLGPSDWEAEGRVSSRTIHVEAFRIDAFEVTRGAYFAEAGEGGGLGEGDPARAASGITRSEAAAFCASKGGRLPTEDEWIVAAGLAGASSPRRYPWGDTGAVCRRAAWGLQQGPCAIGASGPDTVGAHAPGDSPLGIHDLGGNVAEWVAPTQPGPGAVAPTQPGPRAIAKGGSWQSSLASDMRIWARLELPSESRDTRVGVRCAYAR